jgi:hypothetical protein
LPFLQDALIPGVHVFYSFNLTKSDALRITVTKITFDDLAVDSVKVHGAERAHRHASTATNAYSIIDTNTPESFVSRNGPDRASDLARGILALLARHGNVDTVSLPFNDPNPAADGIGNAIMLNRTHELAEAASGAFFMIDHQNLFHYFLLSQVDPTF